LLAARHQALEEGITVNPEVWQQLRTFAAQTLVEASALSRSGAGPA
jgi:LDH2 family malate/lactate/ureidoglycolate dehydrogenase